MASTNIYLDESGDLGWKFDQPYRRGGSSRYLTIACLIVSPEKKHLPKRILKKLYQKFNWDSKTEKKWSEMTVGERVEFATKAKKLIEDHSHDIKYVSITVRKQNVKDHIRKDANKLYNYMIGLSLFPHMKLYDQVMFIPDPRSVKVESGNSLHDYLQTSLWFQEAAETVLTTKPIDSSACVNLQFADMLSGIVQGHFEDTRSEPWDILSSKVSYKTLFF